MLSPKYQFLVLKKSGLVSGICALTKEVGKRQYKINKRKKRMLFY
jgi:hypothetical protein